MSNNKYIKEAYPFKKRISFFFLFSFFFFLFSFSQNLIQNGNFEIYSSCPQYLGEIKKVVAWDSASGTPDYCNGCATYSTGVSVPFSSTGYQMDCNGGQGYAGIWTFNGGLPNEGREYINIKLSDTLKQYHKYVAGIFVSLSNYCSYAISTMGMYFSNIKIYSPNIAMATYINIPNPQVRGKFPLTDTLNWMAVQDTFVAQGGELYLTIGNFRPDSLSDTTRVQQSGFNGSYYYIDSVTVFDTGLMGVNEFGIMNSEFKISPNPTSQFLEIESGGKKGEIIIFNFLGNELKKEKVSGKLKIDVNDLPKGVYFVKFFVNDAVMTKKFIKE